VKGLLITNDFPPMGGGEAAYYDRLCGAAAPDRVVVLAPRFPGDREADAARPYRVLRARVPMGAHPLARMAQVVLLFGRAIAIVRRDRKSVV